MDLDQLMKFAHAYNSLGWATQEQLHDIARGDYNDLNPNAAAEINRTMRGFNDELDDLISEALAVTA